VTPELPPLSDLIDGERTPPTVVREQCQEDPNTGTVLGPQLATHPARVERALATADAVHRSGTWSGLSADERAAYLHKVADALEARAADAALVEAAITGVPVRMTSMLTMILSGAWRLAAEQALSGWRLQTLDGPNGHAAEVHRLPWGPALCLVPWNAPAPMAAHKVANALAAGCPTILKPSERAPQGCGLIADAVAEAGLPDGAFQLVHGGPDTGGLLVSDPRIRAVSFTGGVKSGQAIAAACAPSVRPAQLELGGHNPLVVLPDADLDVTADGIVALLTSLNGQWCRALGRLIVPASRQVEIVEAVVERLGRLVLGSSTDAATEVGPIIHSAHLALLQARIDELVAAGGTVHAPSMLPGGDLTAGSFLAPTLVTGLRPEDSLSEIFGPVATVHPYADLDEALALANGTDLGLEAYVFGGDEEAAMVFARQVRAGGVKVNGSTVMSLNLFAPRGAWGLSGFHDEGTVETYRFFTNVRVVGVEGPMVLG
jgi:acyl-CoA reductase-like NAD-dependent aldehyde dehydrogenase